MRVTKRKNIKNKKFRQFIVNWLYFDKELICFLFSYKV